MDKHSICCTIPLADDVADIQLASVDHPVTFSAMLDSGAGVHTCPGGSLVPQDLTSSGLEARLADGSVVQADTKGTLVRSYGTHHDSPIAVHCIPNTRWLQSIPLLLEKGHEFWLTNKGSSYEFMKGPNGQSIPVPIGRTRHLPDGSADGYLINTYTCSKGRVVQTPVPSDGGRSVQLMKSAIACLTDDHHVEPASSVPALAVAETPLPHAGRFRTATSREHSINARLLHERLNHPSHDRLLKWSKIALGFPSPNDPSTKKLIESAACHDRTCDTCHVAKDKRTGVPSSSRVGRSHRPGMTWSVDFTRTFPASTPEGSTTALVAMERATHYIKIYLLSSHTDFWDAAQQLVDWCASHVGTEIRELQGDCDVIWSTGPLHQPTVQCIDFCTHNQINFSKSPPYTQNLNRLSTCKGICTDPKLLNLVSSLVFGCNLQVLLK